MIINRSFDNFTCNTSPKVETVNSLTRRSSCDSQNFSDLPLLPRNEILSQPTKNRARRGDRKRHSSPKNQEIAQETSNLINLTPPAAEYDRVMVINSMNEDASNTNDILSGDRHLINLLTRRFWPYFTNG